MRRHAAAHPAEKVEFQDRKRNGILGKAQEAQERARECLRVESGRAAVEGKPEHEADAEEPHAAYREEQPRCPAPVRLNLASPYALQRHGRAQEDEHAVQGRADVLDDVAHCATPPHHVDAGQAGPDRRAQVQATIPSMQAWRAGPQMRQQLQQAAQAGEEDDDFANMPPPSFPALNSAQRASGTRTMGPPTLKPLSNAGLMPPPSRPSTSLRTPPSAAASFQDK